MKKRSYFVRLKSGLLYPQFTHSKTNKTHSNICTRENQETIIILNI